MKREEYWSDLNLQLVRASNEPFLKEGKHYVSLVYITYEFNGKLKNKEGKDKCKGWKWFSIDNLPSNTFQPVKESIEIASKLILK